MKNKYLVILSCCLLKLSAWGIEPPKMQCINMNFSDTECQVSWNHPNAYSGIATIQVWVSTSQGGPYLSGGTVNAGVNSTEFNFNTVFGTTSVDELYCYLLATPTNPSESPVYSDTMRSMKLTLTPIGNWPRYNSIAKLEWTRPVPFPSTCQDNFLVWRKGAQENTYSNIAEINQNATLYYDTIAVCEETYSYFVSIQNEIGPACQFKTRPKSDNFADGTPPHTPILDSVSVNRATQLIEIGWTQTSPDAVGCIIYHNTDGGRIWPAIDTVRGNYWRADRFNHLGNTPHYYRIAAIDECFFTGGTIAGNMTSDIEVQHNFIVSSSKDICRRKIKLQWNPYEYMTGDLREYQIYYKKDNGNWLYLATVNNQSTSYECIGLPTNHRYSFIVKAVNTTGNITASSSCCNVTDYTEAPSSAFCYIRHVSVIENQFVEISILTDGNRTPFTTLTLFRSINDTLQFEPIASINYQSGLATYTYEDHTADFLGSINYYKAVLHNECGAEIDTSNIAHTILLTGEGYASWENLLRWNNYSEFDGGTESYTIFRNDQINLDFIDIEDNIAADELNTHLDDISDLFEMGSRFQYYVVAHEGPNNKYNITDEISISNILEIYQTPNTFIPSAFYPQSEIEENQVFKPINSFMNTEGYLFEIYSRQGEKIFFTKDINEGWNGTEQISKKPVPAGVYVYRIVFILPDGKKVLKHGTVTLLY